MEFAYGSIPIQAIGALAVLSLLGDCSRLQMLILGSQTSALICSVVAAFFRRTETLQMTARSPQIIQTVGRGRQVLDSFH